MTASAPLRIVTRITGGTIVDGVLLGRNECPEASNGYI